MPRLSKIGAAALAAFGWTGLSSVSASYLQVAGGGGGGWNRAGGGGAGGLLSGTVSLNPTLSYTVIVGAGGAGGVGASGVATNGADSTFGSLTSSVGGGKGGDVNLAGSAGGSGGGSSYNAGAGGAATSGQGNAGGASGNQGAGGGGGAGAAGSASSGNNGGNGGVGLASSITGTSTYYAGGGGGGSNAGTTGTGGLGGGGNGGVASDEAGFSGTANLGGGGGAGNNQTQATNGGNGGSGVVIISYLGAQQFGGGVVTSSGGYTIHTFNTSGTLAPLSSLTASYLIVAGGGGGGSSAASVSSGSGGGAGGLLSGSGLTIDTNSTYLVTVGSGGAGGASGSNAGVSGSNSLFSMVSTAAVGGGFGTNNNGTGGGGGSGGNGGSGGGSFATAGTGTSGQGNAGGSNASYGGGGGGASAVGGAGNGVTGGAGGAGTASSISGTSTYYAGGGGGSGPAVGAGGSGGGGAGGYGGGASATNAGVSGTANLGGGGGGSYGYSSYAGGSGGSGVVIISYAGSVQQMAGGTVTISGGNVIHTFTSSGYLTPLKLVNNSVRFRASASAYLNRTPPTAGNRRTYTFSAWVKFGTIGTTNRILTSSVLDGDNRYQIQISDATADQLTFQARLSGVEYKYWTSSAVYRDPAAWYHIVFAVDTTQATGSDRIKVYVNGVQQSGSNPTTITQNTETFFNAALQQNIGNVVSAAYFDGYMTEVRMIDGQALTPNSFGTFNSYGVWQPITYGGSYGTCGSYLPFTNKTSTTTLGYDFSPNGNNWTTNNISLTTGSTYDSMTDVPTLTSATAANYATINPLDYNSTYLTLNDGNLHQTYAGVSAAAASRATMAIPTTEKFYWEVYISATGGGSGERIRVGITRQSTAISAGSIDNSATSYLQMSNGQKRNNASDTTYGASFSAGQYIQVLYDATAGAIYFGQNNSFANGSGSFNQVFASATAAFTSLSGEFMPCFITYGGADIYVNFGQQPFAYTPPTGYVALNTYNI